MGLKKAHFFYNDGWKAAEYNWVSDQIGSTDGILGGDEVVKSLDEEIEALVEDIDDNSMDVSLIAR